MSDDDINYRELPGMGGQLKLTAIAERVMESPLPPHLKSTALILAMHGNEEGDWILPTVGRIAHLVGKAKRSVQHDLTALIGLGVLARGSLPFGIDDIGGWRVGGHPTPYRIVP